MRIGTFFDMLTIVSVAAWLIALGAQGRISAEHGAVALFGLVVLVAIARAGGMSLPRLAFRIALPVLAIWGLVVQYGGGDPHVQSQILAHLGVLMITLLALYLMFYLPLRGRR